MLRRVGASVLSRRSLPKGSSLPQVVLSLSPLLQVSVCPTLVMFLMIEDGGIKSGIDVDGSGGETIGIVQGLGGFWSTTSPSLLCCSPLLYLWTLIQVSNSMLLIKM